MAALASLVTRLKTPKTKPRKPQRAATGPPRDQANVRGQALARTLLDGLKACLQTGGNETDILRLLTTALDGRVDGQPVQKWQHGTWKGWPYTYDPATGKWWWDEVPEPQSRPEPESPPAWSPPKSAATDRVSEAKDGPRKVQLRTDTPHAQGESQADGPKGPRLVACRAQDWVAGCAPKPVTFGALKQQLKEGLEPTGNLVELTSCAEVQELQNLWKAFGVADPLTALLSGPALAVTGTFLTRACLTRDKRRPAWEDVGLLQVSKVKGPWTLPVKCVQATAVPKPSKETVRLVAPYDYRSFFLGSAKDSPVEIVKTLAAQVGVPVADLLGGQWQESQEGHCHTLVGYVRVKPEVATKLRAASGTNGVFICKPGAREPGSPFWIRRNAKESDEDYLRRVMQLQASRGQPMLHRRGKGANLGFLKRDCDVIANRTKHLQLEGVPAAWDGQDIETFLADQGWTEVSVLSRKKKRWFLKAMPVADEASRNFWAYEIQDDVEGSWTLRLHVTLGQGGSPVTSVRVPPPTRRQAQKEAKPAAAEPPQTSGRKDKSPAAAPVVRSLAPKGRDRSRSPPPKGGAEASAEVSPTALDADLVDNTQTEASATPGQGSTASAQLYVAFPYPRDPAEAVDRHWHYEDWGGCGDCFFQMCGCAPY
eukprot:s1891_g7.t1